MFQLTYDKYKNILKEVASTHLIKYRHTCQPWIPSLCFCTLPFLLVCLVFFVFAIKEFVFQSGDHAALVQQILKEEQNDQFFYLRPRKEHITVSKIEQNLDDRLKGAYFLLILTSIGIIFVVLWLLACGVKGTCLVSRLVIVNYHFQKQTKMINNVYYPTRICFNIRVSFTILFLLFSFVLLSLL